MQRMACALLDSSTAAARDSNCGRDAVVRVENMKPTGFRAINPQSAKKAVAKALDSCACCREEARGAMMREQIACLMVTPLSAAALNHQSTSSGLLLVRSSLCPEARARRRGCAAAVAAGAYRACNNCVSPDERTLTMSPPSRSSAVSGNFERELLAGVGPSLLH